MLKYVCLAHVYVEKEWKSSAVECKNICELPNSALIKKWFLHTAHVDTYKAQSTAIMRVMSSVGSPTDVNTITMVTRPACGIPAAPMLAAVAVILENMVNIHYTTK